MLQNIVIPKKQDEYVRDLKTLSSPELKELLDRQNNILNNRTIVKNLKDNGEKVKNFREQILKELKSREETEIDDNRLEQPLVNNEPTESKIDYNLHSKKLMQLVKERREPFKPFRTYIDNKVEKLIGIETHPEEALSKSMPLAESMDLLVEQFSTFHVACPSDRNTKYLVEDRLKESVCESDEESSADEK